ncbi:hypothetical protein [Rhodospirillum sp. A1_3_36]|uniref:hypothetical protein n=1 Tax=Rhodospirillum sp. A1_3_36 TaxID=3391666 RepID=UPI0039A41FE9
MNKESEDKATKVAARMKETDMKAFAVLAPNAILHKATAMWKATGRADLEDLIAAFEADLASPMNEALTETCRAAINHLRSLREADSEDPR